MKKIIAAVFFICVLFSCKKENPKVEDPVIQPVTTGDLKGKVYQYDQYGNAYVTGLNTTTVTIDSIGKTTVTDAEGRYSFTGISSGIYTILFKKPGSGVIKLKGVNYTFIDTSTYNAEIADIPSFLITTAYLKDTSWFTTPLPGIYYNANISPANTKAKFVAIIGKSANISLADPTSYIKFSTATGFGTTDYARFISYNFLSTSYGFPKDSIIYVKLYPVASTGASYYDNDLKKPVFTAYGMPYPVLSIKMPQ